jgi:hypothetical protein
MPFPFLGYIVASTVLTAVVVLLTGLVNTATLEKGRHHPPPVIARTVKVEVQRHSPLAKEASPAKDASLVAREKHRQQRQQRMPLRSQKKHHQQRMSLRSLPLQKRTLKKTSITPKVLAYKPKALARQRNNYRYGNALGYAQEYGYGPRGLFFSDSPHG